MENMACNQNSDCESFLNCENGKCIHSPIFPVQGIQIVTYILIPLLVGLANVGGIGSGIVKIPILTSILNYNTKMATVISYPIALGSSLANFSLMIREKYLQKKQKIHDFRLVVLLAPAVLIGTNTGVLMNQILPNMFLNGFFIIFMCIQCPHLIKNGLKMFILEQEQNKKSKKKINVQKKSNLFFNNEQPINLSQNLLSEQNISQHYSQNCSENNNTSECKYNGISQIHQINESKNISQFFSPEDYSSWNKNIHNIQNYNQQQNYERLSFQDSNCQSPTFHQNSDIRGGEQQEEEDIYLDLQDNNTNLDGLYINSKPEMQQENIFFQKQKQDEKNEGPNYSSQNYKNPVYITQEQISIQQQETEEEEEDNTSCEESKNNQIQNMQNNETHYLITQTYNNNFDNSTVYSKIIFLVVCLSIAILFSFILGKHSIFRYKKCDSGYWFFYGLQYICLFIMSLIAWGIIKREVNKEKMHRILQEQQQNELEKLDFFSFSKISGAGFTAGLLGGMIGFGAEFVIVPFLRLKKVHQKVALCTSSFVYFIIGFSTSVSVATSGFLEVSMLILFSCISFIGGAIFSHLFYWVVKKFMQQSIVTLIIFTIVVTNIFCGIFYLVHLANEQGIGYLIEFSDFCKITKL